MHASLNQDSRGYLAALVGDGRPLISLTGVSLGLAGGFAILQSATGHFLPHDIAYLRMSPEDLCSINECRIVHFMFHDRISFGGVLIAIAALYLWLAEFPMREGQAWAWWTLLASGIAGFREFSDLSRLRLSRHWHGVATILLLPCFVGGLWKTRRIAKARTSWLTALRPRASFTMQSRTGVGIVCLLMSAIGTIGAGTTIQFIGMTSVFVQTDLTFMEITASQLDAINPRLIPLIAHDRAGFGGGLPRSAARRG